MALYAYRATVLESGGKVEGTLLAGTTREARSQIRRRGLVLDSLQEVHQQDSKPTLLGQYRASRARPRLPQALGDLITLLRVGMPLVEALQAISDQERGYLSQVFQSLADQVSSGQSLSDSMALHPSLFDGVMIHMVAVGEQTGCLENTLAEYNQLQRRMMQLKGKITNALTYPAIVLVLSIGVSIFLMTYVVPTLLDGLLQAGRPIPLATQVVKSISDLLVGYWLWLLSGLVLLVVAARLLLRTETGKRFWHGLQLRLPVLGELIRKQAVARVSMTLAALLEAGMPFVDALKAASGSARNLVLEDSIESIVETVTTGREIGQAFEQTGVFPATAIRVFVMGQASGELVPMLRQLAGDYEQQTRNLTERLTTLLEPMLILVLVGLVGMIAFAVILPMLEAGKVL
jgi:type II secretory pathway component PulF